jgi:hypothetical protein
LVAALGFLFPLPAAAVGAFLFLAMALAGA